MDIVLAGAGVFVSVLVVLGMVLLAPRGAEPVVESASNLSLAPDEQAEPSAAATSSRHGSAT